MTVRSSTAVRSATSGRAPAAAAHPNLVLAAACVCQLMVVLDISVVNVALPAINETLHFSPSGLSWVVSAYTLTFGGLLLLGGRLADVAGHRRTMLAGLTLFAIASMLGGLAHSPAQLIAARSAQGVAAAVLSPVTLTVIMVAFPDSGLRRRALALWGMVATTGSAVGVLLSGVLTQTLGWRWVLFINAPIALVAGAFAIAAVRGPHRQRPARLDLLGAIMITAAMTLLAYGCVHAGERSWADPVTLIALAAALLLGLGFGWWERRAAAPLVRPAVLRIRSVWVATVIIALIGSAVVAGFYFASLTLQDVLGYGPVRAGLAFLPFCVGMAAATMASSRLVERLGLRRVLSVGLLLGAAGMAAFALVDRATGLWAFDLASVPASIGLGACIAPTLTLGTSTAAQGEAGMISGLLNAGRQAGGSIALAVLAGVAAGVSTHAGSGPYAMAPGYHLAFLLTGLLLAIGAGLALLIDPDGKPAPSNG